MADKLEDVCSFWDDTFPKLGESLLYERYITSEYYERTIKSENSIVNDSSTALNSISKQLFTSEPLIENKTSEYHSDKKLSKPQISSLSIN